MKRDTGQVRQRRVFYVPGYDPFPPRRYREFYRKEGAAQAAISGYDIDIQGEVPGTGPYGWRVATTIGGQQTDARVTVLVWSDIVRASMARGLVSSYLLMLRTLWIFAATGAMGAMRRLRIGPLIAAFWPVVMLTGQLALALAIGAPVWWAMTQVLPGLPGHALGALAALAIMATLLRWFRTIDSRFYAYYLLYDLAFVAAHRGAYGPELAARLDAFADQIAAALTEGQDEVLIVGHSSGAALAVSLAAAVERRGLPEGGAALALLTLGQAIPMQAFLPAAVRLRADLRQIAGSTALTWVDVTARGDGVCFWLTDPPAVCGVAPEGARGPLVLSAAFSETLGAEKWRAIRRKFFQVHFQYLAAFQHPRDYDYFQITAGPVPLAARFAGRAPSPLREARVFSPHRSVE